jgi:hypothetical protein
LQKVGAFLFVISDLLIHWSTYVKPNHWPAGNFFPFFVSFFFSSDTISKQSSNGSSYILHGATVSILEQFAVREIEKNCVF